MPPKNGSHHNCSQFDLAGHALCDRGPRRRLETFPGAACCHSIELPRHKAAPLQALDAHACAPDPDQPNGNECAK
jgi:hypothetical protein